MKITAYMKPSCGWSNGVRSIMRKYNLPFEDRDIINDPEQRLQPCVEIDGKMLTDVSGEEVEAYLLSNSLVGVTEKEADAPTNRSCENEAETAYIEFKKDYDHRDVDDRSAE